MFILLASIAAISESESPFVDSKVISKAEQNDKVNVIIKFKDTPDLSNKRMISSSGKQRLELKKASIKKSQDKISWNEFRFRERRKTSFC